MDSPEVAATEPTDRRTGLVLFGVLDLVVAVGYLIRTLAIAFLSVAGASPRPRALLSGELPVAALLSLLPAVFFMALGIGSILGRRWARSLSLVFSSLWLGAGTLTVACLLFVLPSLAAAAGEKIPPAVYGCLLLCGVVLPAAFVGFYRSAAVKAACEWLDPEERWTDRCPGLVLAVMMLLVVGASLALGLGFSEMRQTIAFGGVLPASLRFGFVAAAAAQLAIVANLPRRRRWAWIAAVAILAIRGAGDIAIARNLTVERFERAASPVSKLSPRDAALLEALKNLHLRGPITAYVAALVLLSLALAVGAGKWFPSRPAPASRGN